VTIRVSGNWIVGLVVGSVISSLEYELSLFLILPFLVVDDTSAVSRTRIYMPLLKFPARMQDHGEVMQHFLPRNVVVCLPNTNSLID